MVDSLQNGWRPDGAFYVIPLSDAAYRRWTPGDNSHVTFDWSGFHITPGESPQSIAIAVALSRPGESRQDLLLLAGSIALAYNIQLSDVAIGVAENVIMALGIITAKTVTSEGRLTLAINWLNKASLSLPVSPVFFNQSDIEQLDNARLAKLEEFYGPEFRSFYYSLAALLPQDNPGTHTETMLESSLVINEAFESFDLQENKTDQGGKIRLFYGTNRGKKGDDEQFAYDGTSGGLKCGFCTVQIPRGHEQGELERPGRFLLWRLPENDDRHFVIKEISDLSYEEFAGQLGESLAASPGKSALLFLHGYNTTFEQAAWRAAQLAWDLPFEGQAGFYSWPSAGKLPDYLADEAMARSSVPAFEEFFTLIMGSGIEKIHIIAHSMGSSSCRCPLAASKKTLRSCPSSPKYTS